MADPLPEGAMHMTDFIGALRALLPPAKKRHTSDRGGTA